MLIEFFFFLLFGIDRLNFTVLSFKLGQRRPSLFIWNASPTETAAESVRRDLQL